MQFDIFRVMVIGGLRPEYDNLDDHDIGLIDADIKQRHSDDWSVQDTISYLRLHEEINPALSEEYALREMAILEKKYKRKNKIRIKKVGNACLDR